MQRFACAGAAFLLNSLPRNRPEIFKSSQPMNFKGSLFKEILRQRKRLQDLFKPVAAEQRSMHPGSLFKLSIHFSLSTL